MYKEMNPVNECTLSQGLRKAHLKVCCAKSYIQGLQNELPDMPDGYRARVEECRRALLVACDAFEALDSLERAKEAWLAERAERRKPRRFGSSDWYGPPRG